MTSSLKSPFFLLADDGVDENAVDEGQGGLLDVFVADMGRIPRLESDDRPPALLFEQDPGLLGESFHRSNGRGGPRQRSILPARRTSFIPMTLATPGWAGSDVPKTCWAIFLLVVANISLRDAGWPPARPSALIRRTSLPVLSGVGRVFVDVQDDGDRPGQVVGQAHLVEDVPEIPFAHEPFQGRIDARGQVFDVRDGLRIELQPGKRARLFQGRFPFGSGEQAIDELSSVGLDHVVSPLSYR